MGALCLLSSLRLVLDDRTAGIVAGESGLSLKRALIFHRYRSHRELRRVG
jgi:hypothetical protein